MDGDSRLARVDLPEDLWQRVLSVGVNTGLSLREVCSAAMCSRRFRSLCDSDAVWESLYTARWPEVPPADVAGTSSTSQAGPSTSGRETITGGGNSSAASKRASSRCQVSLDDVSTATSLLEALPPKSPRLNRLSSQSSCQVTSGVKTPAKRREPESWKKEFKERYERERFQQLIAHRRKVLRAQSKAEIARGDIERMVSTLESERERSSTLRAQLASARQRTRVTSAARVWQPLAVTRHHQHLLEQQEADASPLAQEENIRQALQVSLLQVRILSNSLAKKREALTTAEKEVAFLTFKPEPS